MQSVVCDLEWVLSRPNWDGVICAETESKEGGIQKPGGGIFQSEGRATAKSWGKNNCL